MVFFDILKDKQQMYGPVSNPYTGKENHKWRRSTLLSKNAAKTSCCQWCNSVCLEPPKEILKRSRLAEHHCVSWDMRLGMCQCLQLFLQGHTNSWQLPSGWEVVLSSTSPFQHTSHWGLTPFAYLLIIQFTNCLSTVFVNTHQQASEHRLITSSGRN